MRIALVSNLLSIGSSFCIRSKNFDAGFDKRIEIFAVNLLRNAFVNFLNNYISLNSYHFILGPVV